MSRGLFCLSSVCKHAGVAERCFLISERGWKTDAAATTLALTTSCFFFFSNARLSVPFPPLPSLPLAHPWTTRWCVAHNRGGVIEARASDTRARPAAPPFLLFTLPATAAGAGSRASPTAHAVEIVGVAVGAARRKKASNPHFPPPLPHRPRPQTRSPTWPSPTRRPPPSPRRTSPRKRRRRSRPRARAAAAQVARRRNWVSLRPRLKTFQTGTPRPCSSLK